MPSRPARRRHKPQAEHEKSISAALAKLYDIGPYDRNQISLNQINRLREVVDLQGSARAAELVGVCEITLLRVCAGFGHRLRPQTAARVRAFFEAPRK